MENTFGAGVDYEKVLADDITMHKIRARVAPGANGRRFLRLSVYSQ